MTSVVPPSMELASSPQEGVADTGTGAGEVDLAGPTEGVVELDLAFHALQVDGLFEDGLVECGHH